jgi:hypothetical protein
MTEWRRRPRQSGRGEILLYVEQPLACRLPARLADSSQGGFRAVHHFAALTAGQEIRYRRNGCLGRARVIWTRVLPDHVETGFLLTRSG